MPGVEKQNVNIELKDGYLTVSTEHKQENEEKSEESEKSEKSGEDSIKNNGEETFNSEDIEKDEMLGNGEGEGIALTAEEVKDLVEAAIEKIKSDSAEQGGYLNIADSIYKSDFNTR